MRNRILIILLLLAGALGGCATSEVPDRISNTKIHGKNKRLGRFVDFFEACCARKSVDQHRGIRE